MFYSEELREYKKAGFINTTAKKGVEKAEDVEKKFGKYFTEKPKRSKYVESLIFIFVEDVYEVENIESYKDTVSPMEWAMKQYNEVYHRNHKLYLESIEWDTWCKHLSPEEQEELRKQKELETHPFRKFF